MRAAHVVKGAGANLMCGQLRTAAMKLEQTAKQAHEAGGTTAPADLQAQVQLGHVELQQAAQNYMVMLQSLGI
jgi:HPt (histidine-containing phosphotransfer) domain-containing protein